MEGEQYKEVHFHEYCETCVHSEVKDVDEPCDECLDNPMNLHSHKPVNWKEDETKTKQNKHKEV